ncbi:hypothetical protein JCM19241_1287 [Vibrio ishigakensis]|uniref:Uncharacterized protein n=1 Tax=Vibrio ishigakensis TaxID=1481914 RepID=A0A0B8QKD1_9VIBR|nr:hypothetical protein JCM19241_1287 [Vibrio ishigakensis]
MIKVTDIAELLNGRVKGNSELNIDTLVELTHPERGGLAIVRQPSDLKRLNRVWRMPS